MSDIYSVLCDELKKPIYRTMNDVEAAQAINEKIVMVREPIPVADVKAYSIEQGFYADIDEACTDSDATKRKLCKNVRAWIDDAAGKLQTIDVDSGSATTMIEGLVAFELMSRTHANQIYAMANRGKRWVDLQGIGTVGEGHIKSAREINSNGIA